MKKIILNFAVVLFVLSCFFITSCKKEPEKLSKTFSFEIVNAANINLKINSIDFYNLSWDFSGWRSTYDSILNTVKIDKEIQKKSLTSTPESLKIDSMIEYDNSYEEPNCIKINCSYLTSEGTTAYPYVGTLDGKNVSIELRNTYNNTYYKTTDVYFYYKEGVTLNFVKTTDGDYVLCIVK